MAVEQTQVKLTKEQIQAVSILLIGAFLEHFDRMLHVHMASVINEFFFPTTDPFLKELILAFAFCSNYFLTPFGALFFGYIGDVIGRKAVLVLSSIVMAGCSLIVSFLPTYSQIGIAAPIILTLCRMIQGVSGISEVNGVEIYLIESIKPPLQYCIVALIPACSIIGSGVALGITCFFARKVPSFQDSWRLAFFVGSIIAVVGLVARKSLKDASEFTDRQKLLKEQFKEAYLKWNQPNSSINPAVPWQTSLAYFCINCAMPFCFYFIYFYCGEILKSKFDLTSAQVVNNNLWPALINIPAILLIAFLGLLSERLDLLNIIKCKLYLFTLCIIAFSSTLGNCNDSKIIFLFQCVFVFVRFDYIPAAPIFVNNFPILKRFRYTSFIRSVAATFTYTSVSLLLAYVTKKLGYVGILLVFIPFGMCFAWGIYYFEQKEKEKESQ